MCSFWLYIVDPPVKVGGQDVVAAIDESLFSHTPKVIRNIHLI